ACRAQPHRADPLPRPVSYMRRSSLTGILIIPDIENLAISTQAIDPTGKREAATTRRVTSRRPVGPGGTAQRPRRRPAQRGGSALRMGTTAIRRFVLLLLVAGTSVSQAAERTLVDRLIALARTQPSSAEFRDELVAAMGADSIREGTAIVG